MKILSQGMGEKEGKLNCLTTGRTFPSEEGETRCVSGSDIQFLLGIKYIMETASVGHEDVGSTQIRHRSEATTTTTTLKS